MTKRMLLLTALLLPALARAGEINPGAFQLTGASNLGLGGGETKVNGTSLTKDSQFSFETRGLYYVTPWMGVGLMAGLNSSSTKFSATGDTIDQSSLLLGPMVGFDLSLSPSAALFADVALLLASQNSKVTGSPQQSSSGAGVGLEVGARYFLSRAVSLDLSLAYLATNLKDKDTKDKVETSSVNLLLGFSVFLGNGARN